MHYYCSLTVNITGCRRVQGTVAGHIPFAAVRLQT